MKFKSALQVLGLGGLSLLGFGGCQTDATDTAQTTNSAPAVARPLAYPDTVTVAQVDRYHGVEVADPYRWLEDDVRENPAVRAWADAQQALTRDYLEPLPERQRFFRSLKTLWNYERIGVPEQAGERYFYSYNDGLMNQDQVWVRDAIEGPGRLVVDPNTWADDGTTALAGYYPSADGRYLTLLIQEDGSDWRRAQVLDVTNGNMLEDDLRWLKFTGVSWRQDNSGFYYSGFPEPESGATFQSLNTNQALYFHALGSAQANDVRIIYDAEHPEWNYSGTVSHDDAWLVASVWKGTDDRNPIILQNLRTGAAPSYLIEGFDYEYSFIAHIGGELYFRTDRDAPLGRVIAIDPASGTEREVLGERGDALQSVVAVGDKLLVSYLRDAHTVVEIVDHRGAPVADVALPALGTAAGFSGRPGINNAFLRFSSFAYPARVLQVDPNSGATTTLSSPEVAIDPAAFAVRQLFATSADGTRVPMFVVHKRGLQLDGSHPTILYGYGGFAVSLTPGYSTARTAWLEAGGVYVVANLRGGGEYGNDWHKAGTKLNKQNVFDDFIAAAEQLIAAGYTSPQHLAVMGGSNGGLLVGAVINQRPELFAAAVPQVGVMDMLRYHRFTAGRFWVDDYGSANNPDEFKALYAYSPYHNISIGQRYPATLVVTADTDDRVVPGHSFKYAARLQRAADPSAPALLYVESNAGHGAGTPTEKLIRRYSDIWAFLWDALADEG
ncbi:MAG: prolyl oligopeptidase family protein [Pseudomonadales bacterium]